MGGASALVTSTLRGPPLATGGPGFTVGLGRDVTLLVAAGAGALKTGFPCVGAAFRTTGTTFAGDILVTRPFTLLFSFSLTPDDRPRAACSVVRPFPLSTALSGRLAAAAGSGKNTFPRVTKTGAGGGGATFTDVTFFSCSGVSGGDSIPSSVADMRVS